MSLKKNTRWLLICLLFILSSFSVCTVQAAQTKTVSVTLKKSPKTYKKSTTVGTTVTLKLKYKSKALSVNKAKIRSSKTSVAAVNSNGTIQTKRPGTAIITVKYKKRSAKIRLKVKAAKNSTTSTAYLEAQSLPDDVVPFTSDTSDVVPFTSDSEVESSSNSTSSSVSSLRTKLVNYAKSFVGVLPYVYAGNSLKSGTDCSGFIHLIYAHYNISAPRSASEFQSIANISYNDLLPGDIVVYKNGGHVALYIGNDRIVHCKGRDYGTVEDSMWYNSPTGYVRLIKD